MQRRHFLAVAATLLVTAWLGGCSSPQYLQPDPRRTAQVPAAGHGQEVVVSVTDKRDSAQIGTRSGSAMATSVISVESAPLMQKLQAEAERALRDMGFTPVRQATANAPRLELSLDHLGYERGGSQPVVGELRLESVLTASANNAGSTYTGTYTSKRTQTYAVRPSQQKNTEMVSALLSDGLDRAFRDPELAQLLAR